eukprot:6845319-Pyramimonas_sp.AAC.1
MGLHGHKATKRLLGYWAIRQWGRLWGYTAIGLCGATGHPGTRSPGLPGTRAPGRAAKICGKPNQTV